MQPSDERPISWRQPDGTPIACQEKLKILNENLFELRQVAQDALEDALLMGCDETQVRDVLRALIDSLSNPFAGQGGGAAGDD